MARILKSATGATTNDYADLLEVTIPYGYDQVAVHILENDVNAIKYQVLASLDGTLFDTEIKAETVVAKDASDSVLPSAVDALKDPFLKVKVQIKASVGDAQGNVTATILGN